MTNAERYFADRRTNPAYERAYQRAWQGLDPELTTWRQLVRRLRRRRR
jgi:hypothetical protein